MKSPKTDDLIALMLEIGFDLGVEAMREKFSCCSGDCMGVCREETPVNPFRRASTVIECAKCKHSLGADGRCTASGCDCDCDNSDTARLPSDVVKQLERVEADAEANARAHAQASAEHYTEVARAHVTCRECGGNGTGPDRCDRPGDVYQSKCDHGNGSGLEPMTDPTGFAAEDADFLEEQDAAQERAQNLYDTAPCFVCGGPRYSHDGPGQNHDFESH